MPIDDFSNVGIERSSRLIGLQAHTVRSIFAAASGAGQRAPALRVTSGRPERESRDASERRNGAEGPLRLNMRSVAIAAVVLLYMLHQDFWFWREARPLVFGFLPIGLFYHAAFTLASSAVLWLLVKFAWPSHLEE